MIETATAAPSTHRDAEGPKPLRPVRVAVAGLGRAGVAHIAVLSNIPGCDVVAVADPRGAARAALRGMGFRARAFASVRKLLEREKPDAVFVCVAQHERARIAGAALEAGAAVLVEPPMARTFEGAAELVRIAAARERPLACGHALAFQPVFAGAQRTVSEGVIGAVRQARSSMYLSRFFAPRRGRRDFDPSKVAGGVVAHFSSDLLLLLVRMMGEPREARATWNLLYGRVEDELHAMMTLANGVEVGFDTSWSVPGYPRSSTVIELEGEHGKLLVSDEALEIELEHPRMGLPAGETRVLESQLPQPARFDLGGEALYLQDSSFLQWVTGGAQPPNDGATALVAHRVMDALYRSAGADGLTLRVRE